MNTLLESMSKYALVTNSYNSVFYSLTSFKWLILIIWIGIWIFYWNGFVNISVFRESCISL